MGRGLVLNFRYSRWHRVVPWLVPAVLPVAVVLWPGVGISVHSWYLAAFDLHPEDVEVTVHGQLLAAGKVLLLSVFILIGPALAGYAKHFHLMITGRWAGLLVTAGLGMFIALMVLVVWSYSSAVTAGIQARQTAERGNPVAEYYGIKPTWMCLRPTVAPGLLPSDGAEVHPEKPYLLLGDSGGTAALWSPTESTSFKVPLSKLSLLPVENGQKNCPVTPR